jgi:hypothetical protein
MHSSIAKVIPLLHLLGSVLFPLGVQGSFVGIVVGALLYQERDKVVWWSWWSHEVDLVEEAEYAFAYTTSYSQISVNIEPIQFPDSLEALNLHRISRYVDDSAVTLMQEFRRRRRRLDARV